MFLNVHMTYKVSSLLTIWKGNSKAIGLAGIGWIC